MATPSARSRVRCRSRSSPGSTRSRSSVPGRYPLDLTVAVGAAQTVPIAVPRLERRPPKAGLVVGVAASVVTVGLGVVAAGAALHGLGSGYSAIGVGD